MKTLALLFCALVALPAMSASRERPLIDADALAAQLAKSGSEIVVLHVGDPKIYEAGHLPGARLLQPGMFQRPRGSDPAALLLELPDPKALQAQMQQLGIGRSSRVVVVFGKDEFAPATRVMFTLDAAGLGDRVALLDGGQPEWQRRGHPLTSEVPIVAPTTLAPPKMHAHAVDLKYLEQHRVGKDFQLVDARAPEFFKGEARSRYPSGEAPAGHLPGAKSLPFSAVTTADLTLKSKAELTALFEGAGVRKGEPVVVYCHIGQQASAVAFAARLAGYDASIYDGSFQEWTNLGRPVEVP